MTGKTLNPILRTQVRRESILMTGEAGQYRNVGTEFPRARHGQPRQERVRPQDNATTHSDTVEGFFSLLKRGIIGTFHHVSEAHLKQHLAEFDFRYSNRMGLGINDTMRTDEALRGIGGKRLMYRRSDKACYA